MKEMFNLEALFFAMLFTAYCSAGCAKQPLTSIADQPSQATPQEVSQHADEIKVTFTGKVRIVEILGLREATVYPVHFDPMFLLVVAVLSVEHDKTPARVGKEISFAIHSPVRLFGTSGEDAVGKTYQFTATWRPERGFSWLEARPSKP
jgi:hypothetical protein